MDRKDYKHTLTNLLFPFKPYTSIYHIIRGTLL
uniref:Uncharacterized protein n=1 Tax=Moniliophthora roreri TaxID=221103 RepID=A0A0W0FMQ1_MONRR